MTNISSIYIKIYSGSLFLPLLIESLSTEKKGQKCPQVDGQASKKNITLAVDMVEPCIVSADISAI